MVTANSYEPKILPVEAGADLSAKQYYLMAINSSGQLAVATVRGQRVHGVLMDDPAAQGRSGALCYGGVATVESGGTFSAGDPITTDSSGKAVKADQLADVVIGTAREAGVSGSRSSIIVGVAGGYVSDPSRIIVEDFEAYDTTDQVTATSVAGVIASGTAAAVNVLHARDNTFAYTAMGTQTIVAPVITAGGLDIGMDQTDNDGVEMWTHKFPADGRPFRIGDAAFYMKVTFNLATLAGTDEFHIGFRRAEAHNGTYDNYLDLAALGCEAADGTVDITTILNNGGTTVTDSGDTIVAATDTTFAIYVSAAGVVTYQHDIDAAGTLAAPGTTAAFTFDNGDPVIPFVYMIQANGAQTGVLTINQWEVGYQ